MTAPLDVPFAPAATRAPDAGAPHTDFPALDGLRAVAVLLVIMTHVAFWTGNYQKGFVSALYARMDCGVAIFFVLSGFLLARPWLVAAARSTSEPPLKRYLVRRVARILPAYWLAVVLCLSLLRENRGASAADWVRHFGLVQIYHYGWLREGLSQTWSLCTEVAFYLLLPVAVIPVTRLLRRRGWSPTWPLLMCLVFAIVPTGWALFLHSAPASNVWVMGTFWLPAYTGWFGAGIAMAVLRTHLDYGQPGSGSRWSWAEDLGRNPGTCWSVAAAALLLSTTAFPVSSTFIGENAAQSAVKNALYVLLAMAAAWPAVFGHTSITNAVLANRAMRYVGTISYGMFLFHVLVLDGVMMLLDDRLFTGSMTQVLLLTVAGTVGLAAVSFRWVERPVIRLAHRAWPRGRGGPAG